MRLKCTWVVFHGSFELCVFFIISIDPVGKLLFREEKSVLVTGTAPFPPLRSFG